MELKVTNKPGSEEENNITRVFPGGESALLSSPRVMNTAGHDFMGPQERSEGEERSFPADNRGLNVVAAAATLREGGRTGAENDVGK